jgi:serine/threonine protein kinase
MFAPFSASPSAASRKGQALPQVSDLPANVAPEELLELLRRDQRQRWLNGAPLGAELYREAYPLLAESPAFFFQLIYNEFLLREELHDHPSVEEYEALFPAFADQFRRQLELRQAPGPGRADGAAAEHNQKAPQACVPRGKTAPPPAGEAGTTQVPATPSGRELPALPETISVSEAIDVLLADQRRRWRAGKPIPIEEYVAHCPQLRCPEPLLTLIFHELQLRRELHEVPTVEEYEGRYPDLAAQLRHRIELDESFRSWLSPRNDAPCHVSPPVRVIAGYEVQEELGRGGMGVVYKAWQRSLNRPVALKMLLHGIHAGGDDLRRFLLEAEAAARLAHPSIIQVYEVGQHDGCPYFTMEYVDGKSLAHVLRGRPQAPREAARFILVLAQAVQFAHDHGIIHRDLKPSNILLQRRDSQMTQIGQTKKGDENRTQVESKHKALDGPCVLVASSGQAEPSVLRVLPKIADFGLAKCLDSGHDRTHTGQMLGTPNYMAPEQARGDSRAIGATTDIYGLGTILYEMLTGRPPFVGEDSMDFFRQVLDLEPVSPARLRPGLPRDLNTITLKCLRKAQTQRYASAHELAADLEHFLAGEPITARPVRVPKRIWQWCCRRPLIAGLLAALILVFLTAFIAVTTLWRRSEDHRTAAEHNFQDAEMARDQEGAGRRKAERRLYFNRIALAQRELDANNVPGARNLLLKCRQEMPCLLCWEWGYLCGQYRTELVTVSGPATSYYSVGFAAGG